MAGLNEAVDDTKRPERMQGRLALPLGVGNGDVEVGRAFLSSLDRLTRVYRRRRAHFKAREGGKATDRMFILSDDRPWVMFARETRMQRRKWAFETCAPLQWTALHDASRAGDLDAVKKALSTHQKCSSTPLTTPVPMVDVRMRVGLQCALRRDACGRIALHHAVICDRWAVVKWLLKRADAPLQLQVADYSHRTAAHYALEKMQHIAQRHPCRHAGASVSSVTTLMRDRCPRYRRLWRYVDRMLTRMNTLDVPISGQNQRGTETVGELDFLCRGDLWDACRAGDVKRLEFLVQVYYNTAARARQLEADAVLGELQWSLLHEACSNSHAATVNLLLTDERLRCFRDSALLLLQDTSGSTALHHAAKRHALDVCALLVDECVDIGESDRDNFVSMGDALALSQDARGRTALDWCLMTPPASSTDSDAEHESRSIVAKFLAIKCPAALHVRDHDGLTPLHLAVWCGDAELVRCFLDLGADADASISHVSAVTRVDGVEYWAKTKAPWAPCGLVFQEHKRAKPSMECGAEEMREVQALPCPDSRRSDVLLEDRQHTKHLFECPSATGSYDEASAVYYWIRRMTAKRCASTTPSTKMKPRTTARGPSERTRQTNDSDDVGRETDQAADMLIGCLKYGGSCGQCRPAHRQQKRSDTSPGTAHTNAVTTLPPLILALRVCSRVPKTKLSERSAIVDMLLASGAHPDGSADANGEASGAPIATSSRFCALLEAVRAGHPNLIYTVLGHGATRLNLECLERCCSSDWGVETLEGLLSPLATLHGVIQSEIFIATLFISKCFSSLSQVIDTPLSAGQTNERSVWRALLSHLEESVSRRRQRTSERDTLLDKDHLQFLCHVAEDTRLSATANPECNPSTTFDTGVQGDATNGRNLDGLAELIKFCVCHCLEDWARPTKAFRSRMSAGDRNEDEAAVSHCIHHLSRASDPLLVETAWFEQTIACGFFQAATTVLEARLESGISQLSLDGVFDAFEKGIRRLSRANTTDSGRRHANDFLCVWLSKLLLQNCDAPSPIALSVTIRSVVYACAHNLPLRLSERCLDLVCNTDHQVMEWLMEAMRTTRVNGKRLEQWLVLHRRLDVIHAMFSTITRTTQSVWSVWRELMAAGVLSLVAPSLNPHNDDAESARKWISELFALPSSLEAMGSFSQEFEFETLKWLIMHRVVPNDCELALQLLLPRIRELEQQREISDTDGGAEQNIESKNTNVRAREGAALRRWCARTQLVYACARWNATQVLTYTLEAIKAVPQAKDDKMWITDIASCPNAVDGYSAVEIARLMGHFSVRKALSSAFSSLEQNSGSEPAHDPHLVATRDTENSIDDDVEESARISESRRTFGFLRAVLTVHELIAGAGRTNTPAPTSTTTLALTVTPTRHYFADPSISEDLETACRSNRVHQLAILTDLLSSTAVAITVDGHPFGRLLLASVANGALDALRWLLTTYGATSLTEDGRNACVELAARRMTGEGGGAFAEMLLLMLEHSFPLGRLAGDGAEITILHRAACVGNAPLAQRVISRILEIEGCDINVLDSHGNTPVVYALASGRLENACFLMQHPNCRLEAEYEGQACFYYSLNLVSSLPARLIVKALLMNKRAHTFLHCDADSGACACKSFEMPVPGGDDGDEVLCNFCGHTMPLHRVLPLPSWFRDQYDSYIDSRLTRNSRAEQSDEEDGSGYYRNDRYGDDDNNGGQDQEQQGHGGHPGAAELVSEDDLENTRGRLDADALARLALIQYKPIVNEFELHDPLAVPLSSSTTSVADEPDLTALAGNMAESVWPMVDLHVLDADSVESRAESAGALEQHNEDEGDVLDQWVRITGADSTDRGVSSRLPWFVRADVAMLHPVNCVCQCQEFVTTPQMLLYLAVCRWLRLTAAKALSLHWQAAQAFRTWRYAMASPPTERIEPSLLNPTTRCSSTDLPTDPRRELMLKRAVVAHWRLGRRALSAIQAWKQRSTSPELAHHALENAALDITADMRRNRLETLRLRQRQVQQAARAIILSSQ